MVPLVIMKEPAFEVQTSSSHESRLKDHTYSNNSNQNHNHHHHNNSNLDSYRHSHSETFSSTSAFVPETDTRPSSSLTPLPETQDIMRRHDDTNSSVQVAIRIRPLLHDEDPQESLQLFASVDVTMPSVSYDDRGMRSKSLSESTMATIPESFTSHSDGLQNYQMLQVGEGDMAPAFTFDHVFPSTAGQEQVYETCVTPLVESCLEGYNATVLAYGQTGSGKTHTILGDVVVVGDQNDHYDDDYMHGSASVSAAATTRVDVAMDGTRNHQDQEGVIPRALKDIFRGLKEIQKKSMVDQHSQESKSSSLTADAAHCSDKTATPVTLSPGTKQMPFEYCIKIQFVELYGEEIRDLLVDYDDDNNHNDDYGHTGTTSNDGRPKLRKVKTSGDLYSVPSHWKPRNKITIRDGKAGEGAELIGIERFEVKSAQEALNYLQWGLARRRVGRTAMNAHSSRSHAIFTVVVHQTMRRYLVGESNSATRTTMGEKLQVEMKTSKIHFVDLCGSERAKRAQTAGKRLKEGIDINKGLLALGNVISALGKSGPKAHVPYRDSKLTRILKGSLGGNHKTLMIACVSPSLSNMNETTNTLRYANRAKNIKNNAKINVDPQYQVVHELRDQVAALAAELLRMRRSNKSCDDDEDFPFSLEFLNELVRGGDGSVWRKKEGLQRSASMNIQSKLRPSTSPAVSVVTPERAMRPNFSWALESGEIHGDDVTDRVQATIDEDHDAEEWDANSAEDPELAKNIESYDFALATLRQSVSQKMARKTSKVIQQHSEPDKTTDDKGRDYDVVHDESNEHDLYDNDEQEYESTIPPAPPSPPSALKKIRNIDELYNYLNNNTYVDENGKIVDDEGTVVSEVVQSHVLKLEEAISQNEKILREMETSHEIFELMKSDNLEKLAEIETELHIVRKEKESLSSVHSLLDEESQHSKGLEKALEVKDRKIADLLEERQEVLMLRERSNDNLKSMKDLKKSISVMKKQHSNLSRIKSKPPSHEKLSIVSFDDDDDDQGPHLDTISAAKASPSSDVLTPKIDYSPHDTPSNNQKHDHKLSTDSFYTPRSRFSTWESEDSPHISDVDTRLRDANRNAHDNSVNPIGRRVSLGKIPRFLETPLDTTNHSNISQLETPGFGSDHGVEIHRTPRFSNRRRSATLETHYERSNNSIIPRSHTIDGTPFATRKLRRTRGSRTPSLFLPEAEPLSYQKMLMNRDALTLSTHSVPRSVFDVVDDSISRSYNNKISSKKSSDVDYDSGGEDHNWCGAGLFFDAIRDMFGFKNPVLRKWEI